MPNRESPIARAQPEEPNRESTERVKLNASASRHESPDMRMPHVYVRTSLTTVPSTSVSRRSSPL